MSFTIKEFNQSEAGFFKPFTWKKLVNTKRISSISIAAVDGLEAALNSKQSQLGYTPENVANKEDATLDSNSTKYPTNKLVKEYVDNAVLQATPITSKIFNHQNFI